MRGVSTTSIDRNTCLAFLDLPGMMGQRLFQLLDRDHDRTLTREDWLGLVATLVHGSSAIRYRLLYDVSRTRE